MRRKFVALIIVFAVAMGAFTSYYVNYHLRGGVAPAAAKGAGLIGAQRPDFVLSDYDGKQVPVSTWDGKVVMLNFWASWCPPCRREIPVFSEVREFFHDSGFEVVGIAMDDKHKAADFLQAMPGVKYPQLVGYNDAIAVAKLFGNRRGALPYSVIFDRRGTIRFIKAGELSKTDLIEQVEPLL